MDWANGKLKTATIKSKLGHPCVLQTKEEILVKNAKAEVSKITVNNQLYYRTSFNTETGKTYDLNVK